ncbi:hypothetical protein V6N13_123357 [Hibiscus sabdariffa]
MKNHARSAALRSINGKMGKKSEATAAGGGSDTVVEETIFCSSSSSDDDNNNNNKLSKVSLGNSKVYSSVVVAPSFGSCLDQQGQLQKTLIENVDHVVRQCPLVKSVWESASSVCEPVLLLGHRMVEDFRVAVNAGRLLVSSSAVIHRVDCKEALQMIDRARHSTRRSSIVEHILRLLNQDWVVRLEFVPREGNVVADYMAKRACGDDLIYHRFVSP